MNPLRSYKDASKRGLNSERHIRIIGPVDSDNDAKHTCTSKSENPKVLPRLLLPGFTFRKMLVLSAV